ncbi:class II aldolase/adducin family protein [Sulfobacillus sp. hq2]|uniref:class II aldolase/adducin family protein n=1 Tax=Sulfobacillus TaxID=28033 RepID=UPI000CD27966|nr:class II aldolase/adducin family protein [Sulfobacillus sp. hq2]POB12254.1 class II aldolase [Sulfobacillus sp. hq2]
MTMLSQNQAKQQLVEAAHYLAEHGLLFRGNHANLSAKVGDNHIIMTKGGSIENLTLDDFALVDLNGTVIEGEMEPTMKEIIEMHTGIYRVRDSVGSVIHTHAPHVTAFGVAQKPIPLIYEPLLRFGVSEPIPVVPWAPRGSRASVDSIIEIAQNHPGLPALMMANHGVLVFNDTPMRTASLLGTLDEAAELYIMAASLGGAKELPAQAIDQVKERMMAFGSSR